MNLEVLWLFAKLFSAKFGDVAFFGDTSKQSVKVFSAKIVFSTNLRKFSPLKVSHYTRLAERNCMFDTCSRSDFPLRCHTFQQ